eukprot:gene36266-43994_t
MSEAVAPQPPPDPPQTPIPTFRVVLLGLILAANNTSIWMIFSFLPFMVQHYFPSLSVTELGYEAGMLGSAFSAGGLIGNILWGVVSDRLGRRPTILFGLLGTAVSALAFGFAPTFYAAVAARFMWGFLNGNIGVTKTYLTEICDDSNAARGMATYGAIGNLGRTIGPILGGFLSSPAEKYAIFQNTIFETYPYALPSVIVSANCVVILVLSYVYLHETLPAKGEGGVLAAERGSYVPLRTYEDLDTSTSASSSPAVPPSPPATAIEMSPLHSKEEGVELTRTKDASKGQDGDARSASTSKSGKRVVFSGIVEVSVMDTGIKGYAHLKSVFHDDTPLPPSRRVSDVEETKATDGFDGGLGVPSEDSYDHVERGDSLNPNSPPNSIHSLLVYSNGADNHHSAPSVFQTIVYSFSQPDVFITTCLYGIIALAMMVYNEVFPLWVVTPPSEGGFALTSDKIGGVITVCGIGSILLQVFVYPWLAERSGVLKMFKMALVMLMIGSISTPMLSVLIPLHCPTCNYVGLVAIQLLMIVSSNWAFVSLFVLISNAAYRSQRATVNSIGQTCASLGRLVGPVLGANVFAWSENNDQGWPLNFYLVFYLVCLCCVWSFLWVGKLPRSIERRKREPSNAE